MRLIFCKICIRLFIAASLKLVSSQNLSSDAERGEPLLLTPLIENGDLDRARALSEVTYFQKYNVSSFSGFFTVNSTYNSNLFFWFLPCTNQSEDTPLMLWLQGGPGQASTLGLFVENGPFEVGKDQKLSLRERTWTKILNMLYIDSPVGSGFSFTENPAGYATEQDDIIRNIYEALTQFFVLFPTFADNEFYIAGESYAGKYISNLVLKIHEENEKCPDLQINLKGISIGNGFIDPHSMLNHGDYLFELGLIDVVERDYFQQQQDNASQLILQKRFIEAFLIENALIFGFYGKISKFKEVTGLWQYYNILRTENPFYMQFVEFLSLPEIRESVHVGNVTFNFGYRAKAKLIKDIMQSAKSSFQLVLDHGYKTLLYSGNLDIIVGTPMTLNFIENLQWKFVENFTMAPRTILRSDDSQVIAYLKKFENFYFAIVRNAGHMAITDQPESCYRLIAHFIFDQDFR